MAHTHAAYAVAAAAGIQLLAQELPHAAGTVVKEKKKKKKSKGPTLVNKKWMVINLTLLGLGDGERDFEI